MDKIARMFVKVHAYQRGPTERETAHRMQNVPNERDAIEAQDIPDAATTTASRLNWSHWQELLEEFGLRYLGIKRKIR
jgi:hypothetical protein